MHHGVVKMLEDLSKIRYKLQGVKDAKLILQATLHNTCVIDKSQKAKIKEMERKFIKSNYAYVKLTQWYLSLLDENDKLLKEIKL